MGLDQYAYITSEKVDGDVDFIADKVIEIQYWRKHANLQGWMESLYKKKGGASPQFNCVPVVITATDLDELAEAVRNQTLPETEGFFFGKSCPEDRWSDIQFIERARQAIKAGMTVFYLSWW